MTMRDQVSEQTMQDGATATGNGTAFDSGTAGFNDLTLAVTGVTTATITVEASNDGTNWHTIAGTKLSDNSAATTITANGLYRYTISGLHQVRARISAYTSGTIDVLGRAQA